MGDLLVRAKLVTEEDVTKALERLTEKGGRLGDNLVALGAITRERLDSFLHRIPREPADIKAIGIDEVDLMGLLLKLIYRDRLETTRQFVDAIKLPYHIVLELVQMAVNRQLLQNLGSRYADNPIDLSYAFTEEGRRWTLDALSRLHYTGPAPVTLEEFNDQVSLQKLTNELITVERLRKGLSDLTFDDTIVEQVGPALNSGRAILLYGPPGNGKTSTALRITSIFHDVIYVPYAVVVEGQIIRVHDPSIHTELNRTEMSDDAGISVVRREDYDARWIPCRRPFVVTGGELTLEMLDLRYDETGHYYEAPLHVKALGGTFIIDDFGRQLVSPTNLLNRWIVPLESRIDYLKLHTGKSFSIPFEELIIFSTNLEPEDLMDPAFLRRLPYKIEVGAPSYENFKIIFTKESEKQGMPLEDEVFNYIVHKLTNEKQMDFAAYMPRFVVDQVVATCRFMGQTSHYEPRYIDYALDNLRVKSSAAKKGAKTSARITDIESVAV
jgi:DNA polymerase III delta prime subunit